MKNSCTCYVLLVLCLDAAVAQIFGSQTQFNDINQRRQLSPQQQGHILSDIQQHQHRFNLQQNVLNSPQQTFPPQQFSVHNYNQLGQQNLLPNQFLNQQTQNYLQNRQVLNNVSPINAPPLVPGHNLPPALPSPLVTQQSLLATNQQINAQLPSALPTLQSSANPLNALNAAQQQNRFIQHHTQTAFTPNFQQQQPTISPINQLSAQQHLFQVTSNPLFNVGQTPLDPEKEKERLKELREKQAIIDKHNQFVEKQYEKSLKRAQSEHLDFVKEQQEQKKKIYQQFYRPTGAQVLSYSQNKARYIYPEETELFNLAIKKYYDEHPTTTTTTTTTTTPAPPTTTTEEDEETETRSGKILSGQDSAEIFHSSQTKLYSELKSDSQISEAKKKEPSFVPTALPPQAKAIQSLDDLSELQSQYKSQQIGKDDLIAQLRLAIGENPDVGIGKNLTSREISLPNGQRVEIIRTTDPKLIQGAKPIELGSSLEKLGLPKSALPSDLNSREISLPNGQKVEIIRTTDPKLIAGAKPIEPGSSLEQLISPKASTLSPTTTKPPKEILDELTKVVPPGSNYEILKHENGGLEQIGGLPTDLPNQKKVTFVLLEEQNDGSFKVQGVKGNGEKEKDGVDVDSILKRIKEGDIKLPPSRRKIVTEAPPQKPISTAKIATYADKHLSYQFDKEFTNHKAESAIKSTTEKTLPPPTTSTIYTTLTANRKSTVDIVPSSVTVTPNSFASSEEIPDTPILRTNIGTDFIASTPPTQRITSYITNKRSFTTSQPQTTINLNHTPLTDEPLPQAHKLSLSPPNDLVKQASTISQSRENSLFSSTYDASSNRQLKSSTPTLPSSTVTIFKSESISPSLITPTEPTNVQFDNQEDKHELVGILKKNGLYAMAKFLKQSGLDTILNETGPYTIFAPNDKAFRTLLVQLGGPDKAEEKFKNNPRLLSGLLLHHVIPGSFKIGTLQDEMTGVSLAGTQLRVNQYNMHDVEWNDVKITTINGAKVLEDKQDIEIPQGVAHGIDRVMFPLPVGDIVQTLQSDRERRFTSFLRALFSSGLAETLQGTKTFTLFAPTDRAFAALSNEDLTKTVSDRVLARELLMRHLIPGTFYTNGMRYYQIRDSLEPAKQITLSKTSGKVKANNVQIATQNIPATNGVIHAVDALL